ncbi:MAG: SIS domain-containing protein, partial [Thermoplasmata archaeon]
MNKEEIMEYIKEGVMVRETIDIDKILEISTKIVNALKNGKKIILMGNGGSAADAQHIAAEIVGKFEIERKALPAIVLHGNTSSLTAIANDFGYDHV